MVAVSKVFFTFANTNHTFSNTLAATSIGHRLRKLRESKDLGQDWIAHELGMSVSGYSRIERDEVKITYDKLERIATILNVPVADILNHQEASQVNDTTTNNNTNNNGQTLEIEKLESLYREQINNLREEVAYLRDLLRKTMEK